MIRRGILQRAFGEFAAGVLKRFYFWGFALLLDPFDLYTRFAPVSWPRPPAMDDPWPSLILFGLILWCAFLTYLELRIKLADFDIEADMTPKEALAYLCKEARMGGRFSDRKEWFYAAEEAIRDSLRQGRITAFGREPGDVTNIEEDGRRVKRFLYPRKPIEAVFWERGDVNWFRALNAAYHGPVDAWDSVAGVGVDDVMFCRLQVQARWPRRSFMSLKLWPTPFEPLEMQPPSQKEPCDAQETRTET